MTPHRIQPFPVDAGPMRPLTWREWLDEACDAGCSLVAFLGLVALLWLALYIFGG